jgi:uncharacterized membrane protein
MTAHPFDLRNAIMAKHAQHVVLIHFPIALFLTGVALDFAAQWTKKSALAAAAHINLMLAAVATIPAAATGLVAWQWALEGQRLKGILLLHLVFALISTGLIWTVWCMHFVARRASGYTEMVPQVLPLGWSRLVVEAIGVILVAITGHLGGFLSGVNN